MKIVVSHVYSSDNKGDAALVSVLLQDIKRKFPGADITILTLEAIDKDELYEGARQQPSFIYYAFTSHNNRFLKLLDSLFITTSTLLWALVYRSLGTKFYLPPKLRAAVDTYAAADLIIPVGGGYIRSDRSFASFISLCLLLHPLLFGHLLHKPTVLYTQSIGPFYRFTERRLVAFVLKRMDLIILREDISKRLLQKLHVTKNVVRSVDSGFAFQSSQSVKLRKKLGVPKNKLLVGVTVRKWLNQASQHQYENTMARTIDYTTAKYSAAVVFIPQVTSTFHNDDDRQASKDVYQHLRNKNDVHLVTDNLSHYEIKAMYDELDVIIGTRFHSVIFSLTSYVPALAIEYEHKTGGIMKDLGLSEWVVKIENIDEAMMQHKIDALIAGRVAYIDHLKNVIPNYIAKAEEAIDMTEAAYRKARRSQL